MSELWSTAARTASEYSNVAGSSAGDPGASFGTGVSCVSVKSTVSVPTIIVMKVHTVTLAPPYLSASQPPNGRATEPTRAPRKA